MAKELVDSSLSKEELDELIYKYTHYCDECPKAHDFTCCGATAKWCQIQKDEILEEARKLKAKLQ